MKLTLWFLFLFLTFVSAQDEDFFEDYNIDPDGKDFFESATTNQIIDSVERKYYLNKNSFVCLKRFLVIYKSVIRSLILKFGSNQHIARLEVTLDQNDLQQMEAQLRQLNSFDIESDSLDSIENVDQKLLIETWKFCENFDEYELKIIELMGKTNFQNNWKYYATEGFWRQLSIWFNLRVWPSLQNPESLNVFLFFVAMVIFFLFLITDIANRRARLLWYLFWLIIFAAIYQHYKFEPVVKTKSCTGFASWFSSCSEQKEEKPKRHALKWILHFISDLFEFAILRFFGLFVQALNLLPFGPFTTIIVSISSLLFLFYIFGGFATLIPMFVIRGLSSISSLFSRFASEESFSNQASLYDRASRRICASPSLSPNIQLNIQLSPRVQEATTNRTIRYEEEEMYWSAVEDENLL